MLLMGRFRMNSEDVILRTVLQAGEFRGMYRFEERGGISIRGQIAGARASQNDLQQLFEDISNAIEAEAIRLTDERVGSSRRNPRNADYPWRRVGRSAARQYRTSFRTSVSRQIGRPGVTIRNVAQSAEYVEFGNDGEGPHIRSRKMMTVPLRQSIGRRMWASGTPTKYAKIRRVSQDAAMEVGFKRTWLRSAENRENRYSPTPMLILRRGTNDYYWLTFMVTTFPGHSILGDALLSGFRVGITAFRSRR